MVPLASSAVDPPATTVWDRALFLNIDVNQLPWSSDFVAFGFGLADRKSGGLVDIAEPGHVVALQDTPHSRAWDSQVVADPVWSPLAVKPQVNDPSFGLGGKLVRRGVGPGTTVCHGKSGPVTVCPSFGGSR